jgi:hypothetical protein
VNGAAIVSGPLRAKITAAYPPSWEMRTLDPWAVGFGSLAQAETLLANLVKRRDALQAQLDEALCEPVLT